jgi:transposase
MQITLFAPTLDDSLGGDHPVRLFDEVLRAMDFSRWENMYVQVAGQPPIHPRIMAAGILYGLSLGIRSSRKLEDACYNRLDFIWLMEGRKPDHATFCKFRLSFGPQLKELFRQVGRVGIEMGLVTLNQVTLDGTSIRANNSRHKTHHRPSLEKKLTALDEQIEVAMAQFQRQDQKEDELFGQGSPAKLPRSLKDLQQRQEKLRRAMAKLEQIEKERVGRKSVPARGPAVPLTDPDSRVLPNKEGGYAPNYTAVLATDSDSGLLLDIQVRGDNNEAASVVPAVTHIQEGFERTPRQIAADSGFNTGRNLAELAQENVEALMPPRQPPKTPAAKEPKDSVQPKDSSKQEGSPPPAAGEKFGALAMNPQNKVLDKSAFQYEAAHDRYVCPTGRTLGYVGDKTYQHGSVKGTYRVYESVSCEGCALRAQCLIKNASRRRVCRDEYEGLRQEMHGRLNSAEGKGQYKRRSHAAETPFAVLKAAMGLRQFLLRGQPKVEQELTWAATAYNLRKLMRFWSGPSNRQGAICGV